MKQDLQRLTDLAEADELRRQRELELRKDWHNFNMFKQEQEQKQKRKILRPRDPDTIKYYAIRDTNNHSSDDSEYWSTIQSGGDSDATSRASDFSDFSDTYLNDPDLDSCELEQLPDIERSSRHGILLYDLRNHPLPIFLRSTHPADMDEELLDSVFDHPKYVLTDNEPLVRVRSSTPVVDLTNHYGLVVIVANQYQIPEIYERMNDIYWGLCAERMITLEREVIVALIFREVSRCRQGYIPLEIEHLETYGNWMKAAHCWEAKLKKFLWQVLPNSWILRAEPVDNADRIMFQVPDIYKPIRGLYGEIKYLPALSKHPKIPSDTPGESGAFEHISENHLSENHLSENHLSENHLSENHFARRPGHFNHACCRLASDKKPDFPEQQSISESQKSKIPDQARQCEQITPSEIPDLGESDDPAPILFPAIGDDLPEVFNEVGYGEQTENQAELENEYLTKVIREQVEAMNFLEQDAKSKLETILLRNKGAFGCKYSQVRMSKLTPMEVELHDDAPDNLPAAGRTMGHEQTLFLRQKLADLEKLGLVKVATNPVYASPAFVVKKKGPKKWRMVVDMRELNKWTKPTALLMPILEEQLARLGDAKYFGSFDVFSGFDYLPTSEKSQKYFNLVTLESCVTMLGAPMGWRNTPQIYQNRILEEILKPAGIYSQPEAGCLQWIDDTLLYATDFDGYFDVLDRFLKQSKPNPCA